MNTQSIDARLLFAQNLIENGKKAGPIFTAMTAFGYDATALEAGKALLVKANERQARQKKEYGEQYTATDQLYQARDTANKEYMKHVKLARLALKDDRGAFESMQLSGNRKDSLSGWLQQAKTFYTNALALSAPAKAELVKYTLTDKVLRAGLAAMQEVETKLNVQLKEKGEAQVATTERDAAFDELQEWVAKYIAIARIALEDDPQQLEILGIVESN